MTDLINNIANSPLIQALNDAGLTVMLFGAIAAFFGYLGQVISGFFQRRKLEKDQKVNRLLDLYSMLRVSRVVYLSQKEQLDGLLERMQKRLGLGFPADLSLDHTIERVYPLMTSEELEAFQRIRGTTRFSMYALNRNLQTWIKADFTFRTKDNKEGVAKSLAVGLNQLESHLSLWKSKYMSNFKDSENKAVVYLTGKHEASIPFPSELNQSVLDMLEKLGVTHLPKIN